VPLHKICNTEKMTSRDLQPSGSAVNNAIEVIMSNRPRFHIDLMPDRKTGWRSPSAASFSGMDINSSPSNALALTTVGTGMKTRITDIDLEEFDEMMKGEMAITFSKKVEQLHLDLLDRDVVIKRAMEVHKDKVIGEMQKKYKRMKTLGVFNEETNKIRIQNMLRCSLAK